MKSKPPKPSGFADSGSYILLIKVSRLTVIEAGALGRLRIVPGYYAYCGNAKNGIKARVKRHLRKSGKKLHWHVDKLLAHRFARIEKALAIYENSMDECALIRSLCKTFGADVPHKGFGASDCRADCRAHLVRLPGPLKGPDFPFPTKLLYEIKT